MCFQLSKNTNLGLSIASVIFGLVAVLHACRLLTHFSLMLNGLEIPLWFNFIGLLITGFLSFWLWTLKSSN